MSESRPYRGKDGNRYSDYYEMQAANTRYDQQQKLIEEQQKANKLINEQNQRIKNGGYTDNEVMWNTGIEYAKKRRKNWTVVLYIMFDYCTNINFYRTLY